MRKILLLIIMILGLLNIAEAYHLKGGWIQYEYMGVGSAPNTSKYKITVRQYLDCGSVGPQIDKHIILGVFDAGTNVSYDTYIVDSVTDGTGNVMLNKTTYDVCVEDPKPTVCYLINKYVAIIDLPNNDAGYILAVQRCCRIQGIVNVPNSSAVGITYSNKIPGTINGVSYRENSSPSFVQKDTVLVCHNSPFTLDFSATDINIEDSLVYSFCDGLQGGDSSRTKHGKGVGSIPNPPADPPFIPILYNTPQYDGGYPMGAAVTIDSHTGIISGTAPDTTGNYVIAVCVQEFRHDTLIGSTKKEIHVTVADCSIKAAKLDSVDLRCHDYTVNFRNGIANRSNEHYLWNFGDLHATPANDISQNPTPTYIYSDTGVYIVRLTVTFGSCIDSTKSSVEVYPSFKPKIDIKGACQQAPYLFIDSSASPYGIVNKWRWDFGETTVSTDTSSLKKTTYLYPTSGQKTVRFWVENSNGCIDSTTQIITVRDNPVMTVYPRDTLICNTDTLKLSATEQGSIGVETFKWRSKDSLIINPTTGNPSVHPKDTTVYIVTMTDRGCIATDSAIVNTLDSITVTLEPDTSICKTDSIQLQPITHGLGFNWKSSTASEVLPDIKNPWVTPLVNTTYSLLANLGNKCFARGALLVNVFSYPSATAGSNDSICYGDSIMLKASIIGTNFKWWPTTGLTDSTSLFTFAHPDTTTQYVLTSYYLQKNTCPKPNSDTIIIKVFPKVIVDAGNDTTVVINEPLKLIVTGNTDSTTASYLWTATNSINTYLNNNAIYNPIAIYHLGTDSIAYIVRATINNRLACYAEDTIRVLVFQTPPDIFVPSAFTPDNSFNNIIKPIPVGVLNLDFFSIYSRFGQLLYTTSSIGQGWNGVFNGVPQPPGTYVYIVQGKNYSGTKSIFHKGTVVLIR